MHIFLIDLHEMKSLSELFRNNGPRFNKWLGVTRHVYRSQRGKWIVQKRLSALLTENLCLRHLDVALSGSFIE